MFQNEAVVICVVRRSRGAGVVRGVLDGHRPVVWVSDLYGAQQGHMDAWQLCLAQQLHDYKCAIDAGNDLFAPCMNAVLLHTAVLSRHHHTLTERTRRTWRWWLEQGLNSVMALHPTQRDGQWLQRRYGKRRDHPFTFFDQSRGYHAPQPLTERSRVGSGRPKSQICSLPCAPLLEPRSAKAATPTQLFATSSTTPKRPTLG